MYLALYRKYRPQTFDEVIGQNHIIQTLVNQINGDKIGHAYLFCGSRGTGKTSTAKIFAKAINCLNPVNGSPCGKCDVCKALSGNNIDILEIDAASNNGVDEIRDLREKVKYPPVAGRYKVYIVDEVHMLSPSAFNALLKTLEEPPSHAVFILATTEVHKLPATILSRCLRFDFGLVSVDELSGLLKKVFESEHIRAEDEAIGVIARAGEGSVRDTLSIADRCVSYSGENLSLKSVMEVLGTTEKEKLFAIAEASTSGDVGRSLRELDEVLSSGKSPLVLSKDLIAYLRDLLVIQTLGDYSKNMVIASEEVFAKMQEQAQSKSYAKIVSLITSLSAVEAELRYSINPRIVLETAIIRSLSDVSLLERVEKLEQMIASGNVTAVNKVDSGEKPALRTEEAQNVSIPKREERALGVNQVQVHSQNQPVDQNILGGLLSYLRERKEMSLLTAIRQVVKTENQNGTTVFYVEDEMTLNLILREKNKVVLGEYFESLGLRYAFKIMQKRAMGDVDELSSVFRGKLEVGD